MIRQTGRTTQDVRGLPESVSMADFLFAIQTIGFNQGQAIRLDVDERPDCWDAGQQEEECSEMRRDLGTSYPHLSRVVHEAMFCAWRFGFEQGYNGAALDDPEQGWSWFFRTTAREMDPAP